MAGCFVVKPISFCSQLDNGIEIKEIENDALEFIQKATTFL